MHHPSTHYIQHSDARPFPPLETISYLNVLRQVPVRRRIHDQEAAVLRLDERARVEQEARHRRQQQSAVRGDREGDDGDRLRRDEPAWIWRGHRKLPFRKKRLVHSYMTTTAYHISRIRFTSRAPEI